MLVTTHPVLDSRTAINTIVQADLDDNTTGYKGFGSLFRYLRADTKAYDFRIYRTPLENQAISDNSFSTYFLSECPFIERLGVRIPLLYSDIVMKGDVKKLDLLIDDCFLLAESLIETLREYPYLPLNGQATCGFHRITDIMPMQPAEISKGVMLWGVTVTHELFPMGINP